ncbi:MAG TPA: DUF1353 domain-containing protein [Anaerolineales bacterium]
MDQICYRELRSYKYQLMEDYAVKIDIKPENDLMFKYMSLSTEGLLTVKEGYAWDGPSGPTIDTPNFMRGSLVHDVLYQMMRLSALDYEKYRKRADEILKEMCLEDGMSAFRAWYVYWAVQLFGVKAAAPRKDPEIKRIMAP